MQIVRGGQFSQLHDLLVICGKTFAIVQQFETPCNKKEKNYWKTFAIRVQSFICYNNNIKAKSYVYTVHI